MLLDLGTVKYSTDYEKEMGCLPFTIVPAAILSPEANALEPPRPIGCA